MVVVMTVIVVRKICLTEIPPPTHVRGSIVGGDKGVVPPASYIASCDAVKCIFVNFTGRVCFVIHDVEASDICMYVHLCVCMYTEMLMCWVDT